MEVAGRGSAGSVALALRSRRSLRSLAAPSADPEAFAGDGGCIEDSAASSEQFDGI